MRDIEVWKEKLEKTPGIDWDLLHKVCEIVKEQRSKNVKCPFPHAQAPSSPYSIPTREDVVEK